MFYTDRLSGGTSLKHFVAATKKLGSSGWTAPIDFYTSSGWLARGGDIKAKFVPSVVYSIVAPLAPRRGVVVKSR